MSRRRTPDGRPFPPCCAECKHLGEYDESDSACSFACRVGVSFPFTKQTCKRRSPRADRLAVQLVPLKVECPGCRAEGWVELYAGGRNGLCL